MNIYRIFRPLLFLLPCELSHGLSLKLLKLAHRFGLLGIFVNKPATSQSFQYFGLNFPNRVGLAAGFDKNGDYIEALAALGFGFIEVGTVTPRAQPGNPKPRLFRLPKHQAIINRMGFNNKGVDYCVTQVKKLKQRNFILGINIGKNFDTPVENALEDYRICLEKVYAYADYITINISSPNTPGLRHLQFGQDLANLLSGISELREELSQKQDKKVPLLVKIAPDLDDNEIASIGSTLIQQQIEGVIITNTTVAREAIKDDPLASELGGLSGQPVFEQSTHVLAQLKQQLDVKLPIIGVGGINSAQQAQAKLLAGADLLQLYSGLIYHGPELINECIQATIVESKPLESE